MGKSCPVLRGEKMVEFNCIVCKAKNVQGVMMWGEEFGLCSQECIDAFERIANAVKDFNLTDNMQETMNMKTDTKEAMRIATSYFRNAKEHKCGCVSADNHTGKIVIPVCFRHRWNFKLANLLAKLFSFFRYLKKKAAVTALRRPL